MHVADAAKAVRYAFVDPTSLCSKLGLMDGAKRQSGGLLIRCPVHDDRNPSCSVTCGPDGTVRARCFSCDWSSDALGLIARVNGLSTHGEDFRELLRVAADLAGLFSVVDELEGAERKRESRPVLRSEPKSEPTYPDRNELLDVWNRATSVAFDRDCSRTLVARKIDPVEVADRDLARVLPNSDLPEWARYHGQSWNETGHCMLVRSFDEEGRFRSFRAWRVADGDTPKRLPPAGRKASGLVTANMLAIGMLRGKLCPNEMCIVEGEPDWLVASTVWRADVAVVGIGSGCWTQGHADCIPNRTRVTIATHSDDAGDRYAEHVIETIGNRCPVWRLSA